MILQIYALLVLCRLSHGSLIKHTLQIGPNEPLVQTETDALDRLTEYFQTLPRILATRRFSCTEYANPRVQPLCKYCAHSHVSDFTKEDAESAYSAFKHALTPDLKVCVEGNKYPTALAVIVDECYQRIWTEEDLCMSKAIEHVKAKSKLKEYMEGVLILIKKTRPLSMGIRVLLVVMFAAATGLLAILFYKYLFGGDYDYTVEPQTTATAF